ncbi:MAG: glutamate racemase [Gammaproteobacteria bacterium]|nr:glutamate racemase [Gammaproteobacteria bacterium]
MNDQAVGIFDSGVGGLSVLKHVHELLPNETIFYVADSGHAPYGCKDEAYVERRSRVITEHLIAQGVKAIVIACNTATASIIEQFRQQYGIPFIGVEPGIKPAIALTKNNNIGVMATSGTLSSERYNELILRYADSVNLFNQPCPGLADRVECGDLNSQETIDLIKKYASALLQKQVDTIVLGCTHYSFLKEQLEKIMDDHLCEGSFHANGPIKIVDTSRAIAEQLVRVLEQGALQNKPGKALAHYFTTGSVNKTQTTMRQLLNKQILVKRLP